MVVILDRAHFIKSKVSFVIASHRDMEPCIKSITNLLGEGVDIVKIHNPKSYSEGCQEGFKKTKNPYIIFLHDDIEIRATFEDYEKLIQELDKKDTGIVGVVGSGNMTRTCRWWEGYGTGDKGATNLLSGACFHCEMQPVYREHLSTFGEFGQVIILDGCFLAMSRDVLNSIGGWKDEDFKFHFYDVAITLRAHLQGFKNKTVSFPLLHRGMGHETDEWRTSKALFWERYGKHLPITLSPTFVKAEDFPKGTVDVEGLNTFNRHRKIRVVAPFIDNTGCGNIRVAIPFDAMTRQQYAETRWFYLEQSSKDMPKVTDAIISGMYMADVIVMRPGMATYFHLMDKLFDIKGKKFVMDLDDDPETCSPFNDAYLWNGLHEVTIQNKEGKQQKLWEHGKKYGENVFDVSRNRREIDKTLQMVRAADLVTVTTEELRQSLLKYNKNIKVLPNSLNFNIWRPVALNSSSVKVINNSEYIRVGWAGGSSHFTDWTTIKKPLKEFLESHPKVKLVIAGSVDPLVNVLKDFPSEQIEVHPWVTSQAHPYRQMNIGLDVGLCPLYDEHFNHCKSALKWTEYSACGVPTLAAAIPPYSKVIRDGENGMVYKNSEEFIDKLEKLVYDAELRQKLGRQAFLDNYEKFNADVNASLWFEAYASLFD